ncbi:DUF4113 domain-containing protein [Plesiomonas shigelloides]|uniref:DUF4113 domain-containing protein n=1 Tax=Plesiomonas shigelloides TaxID=703 RepID=UPI001C5BF807|nr:DUF4113 domain-containing protein [Plesiomonas shigelloides]
MINLISLGLVSLAVFWSGYTCCSFEVATALQCAATADLVRWSSLPESWVILSEFTPKGQQQADLFAPSSAQSDALMAVMDQIKAKGLERVGFASQGTGSPE